MSRPGITRLLVANRGEIAVRIIHACRELGIEVVAVYSAADRQCLHVRLADRAVEIGPSPSAESYLNARRVIEAARETGADAVHPGYGFLSQSAAFAEACEAAGLIFVGPTPAAITAMGSKIEARRLMQAAGVPVVPGVTPEDQSDEGLRRAVERVGLPVLVKASAGGGGKGMRRVNAAGDVIDAVQAARREAVAAFGDGTLYVERRIERARHVEAQVFGDASGQVVHLFERECSVQRRHQKIVEESPAPSIGPALRAQLTSAAVRAAEAVAYRGAGTVEFLVDADGASFFFLEMNTRLQVEHAVTEEVLGVDLVRAQLAVASGRPLPWSGTSLSQRGHAIEARVYAEDPARGFLPQAGPLLLYREPRMPGVRVDSGFVEGDEISVHYDPLIAKVIARDETRPLAIARLAAALRAFPILGIRTNIPFLLRVIAHERFRDGTVDTEWIDREVASLTAADLDPMPPHVRAAIDAEHTRQAPASTPWDPWTAVPALPGLHAPSGPPGPPALIARSASSVWAFSNGRVFVEGEVSAAPARTRSIAGAGTTRTITAPMPGTVVKLLVSVGTDVAAGETLAIIEAMKMEIPIRALDAGCVAAVRCVEGDLVGGDHVLFEVR